MDWTFTQQDAQLIFGFIASVLVPFVVSFIKRYSWPNSVKLGLTITMALLGAVVSQYAAGALDGGSVVVAALGIFIAAQAHFAAWFQGLGFERMLNPPEKDA